MGKANLGACLSCQKSNDYAGESARKVARNEHDTLIERFDLVHRVLAKAGRWVAIHGAPGLGRSTLLSQIASQLQHDRSWCQLLTTPVELRGLLQRLGSNGTSNLRAVVRWLGVQAALSANGHVTLLVDDYDILLSSAEKSVLHELLVAQPLLRVITVSVDLPYLNEVTANRGVGEISTLSSEALLFSRAETEALFSQSLAARHHVDHLQDPAVVRRLFEVTRGVPAAVSVAIDGLTSVTGDPEMLLAGAMNRFITDSMRVRMRVTDKKSLSAVYSTLSLMPRFSFVHVAACFPQVGTEVLDTLTELPTLDTKLREYAGVYSWSEEFLHATKELNAPRAAERRQLAAEFYRGSLAGEAFEQWFLAGDLARAEAMLRTRFLTVFETLSPETANDVSALAPSELAAYPMMRVMHTLLESRPSAQDLSQSAENLSVMGRRGGAVGILALAVRAAVLARDGAFKLAYAQAEESLRAIRDFTCVASTQTVAEERTLAETALLAVLVCFEVGTIPNGVESLPRAHGSLFLRHRREKAQWLLDALRSLPEAGQRESRASMTASYRALVFSETQCDRERAAIAAHDRRFAEVLTEAGAGASGLGQGNAVVWLGDRETGPVGESVKFFNYFTECIRLLSLDDQAGAVKLAYSNDVCDPQASCLQAWVLLITGRAREARGVLDTMEAQHNLRTDALRVVLRAVANLKLGHPEAARSEISRALDLPASVVVQAFSLLHSEDAQQLVAINPCFGRFAEAARLTGSLGTGVMIEARRRFQALTQKERQVLLGLRDGLNTREVADRDFVSVNTVRTHVRSIGKKLDARGQAEMLRRAEELRLFQAA